MRYLLIDDFDLFFNAMSKGGSYIWYGTFNVILNVLLDFEKNWALDSDNPIN